MVTSIYPFDIIVAITTGHPRTGPTMLPTLLAARDLAAIVGTNTLRHFHAHWPGTWHDICNPSMGIQEYWWVSCSKGATYETVSHVLDRPGVRIYTQQGHSPEATDTHDCTSSVQVCVIRPGARTRHGCGGPAGSAQCP